MTLRLADPSAEPLRRRYGLWPVPGVRYATLARAGLMLKAELMSRPRRQAVRRAARG